MIEVDGVTKAFGDTQALAGVSFVVAPGDVLGLLGPNGAGKTTLVRAMATLLTPDRGAIRIGGVDAHRDPATVRTMIGLAGQAAAVDELLTGRENLELIGTLYGLGRRECRERASETLARFGLVDAADRRVGTYSGGMRRRLDLGATLIGSPSVILLDEPTAGLDPRSRNELWALVRGIATGGTTIVLTSQYLEEVEQLANRIVVLKSGAVVADAPPAQLKTAVAGEVLEARVAEGGDVGAAVALLSDVDGDAPVVDDAERRVAVATSGGVAALVAAARRLDDAGIALDDLAIRRPSLDDVFLALTDDAGEMETVVVPRAADGAAPVRHDARRRGPRALRAMAAITRRYLRRFARVPQMFIFGAIQPVVFVVGLEAVFGGLVEGATGQSYIQYLLPGVVVMHVVFTGGITSVGLAEDLQAGIVDRFRSLPISRSAVLVGRTNADLVRNAIGLAMAVAASVAMGFRWRGTVGGAVAAVVLVVAFSYALSWLFACIGMAVPPQAAQLASFLPTLPLVYLSGAWIPVESIADDLQTFVRHQPINVVIATVRALADGAPVGSYAWQSVAWTVGIFVFSVVVATRLYGRTAA